jgi:hypothetical protein
MPPINHHTTKGHIEMSLATRLKGSLKTTIVESRRGFIALNEIKGFALGKSTDCRRGMKGLQECAQMMGV